MRIALAFVLAACVAPIAAAIDLPKRKSGLWEMVSSREGADKVGPASGTPIKMCVDEKSDDLSRQLGENASKEMCEKRDMRREGDRIVTDSVCKFGETTATTHSVMTGKFDSSYELDVRTKFQPAMMGMTESHTTIKARWVGPCAAGQRPGDVIMPNGMKMNVFDAEKAAKKP